VTLVEALNESKANGNRAYIRESGVTWVRWDETQVYPFTAEDIVATDWRPLEGHTFGGGRYVANGETL
jgi:hypothetical protein